MMYPATRAESWAVRATMAVCAVALWSLTGFALPGCSPSQQQTAVARIGAGVRSAHEATNTARDSFLEANRTAEAVIVATATSEAQGLERLRQLDVRRAPVLRAFTLAYAALARAESLVELVAAGKRDPLSLINAAQEVARAAEDAYNAVRAFGGR